MWTRLPLGETTESRLIIRSWATRRAIEKKFMLMASATRGGSASTQTLTGFGELAWGKVRGKKLTSWRKARTMGGTLWKAQYVIRRLPDATKLVWNFQYGITAGTKE